MPNSQLEDIMMTGGPPDVPMGMPGAGGPPPGPPMGGPPPGPPMGGPPMGGPPPGQDPMASLMGNEAALGGGGMDRGMEAPMSIEEDAGALAEAVIGRAEGDIGAAVAILDTAKEMLISSGGGQDPMMQEPMMANMGRPLMRGSGGLLQGSEQRGQTPFDTTTSDPSASPSTAIGPRPMGDQWEPMGRMPPPPPMPQESRVRRGPGYAGGGSIVSERDTQNMSPDEKDEYFSEIIRMRRGN